MPFPARAITALLFGTALTLSAPALAQTDGPNQTGAYLAARQAATDNDFAASVLWHDRALQIDPTNLALLEGAISARLAVGDITGAAANGQTMLDQGARNQIAYLAVLSGDIKSGDFAKILADQAAGHTIGSLIDKLIVAWAKVGQGRMSDALGDFDAITGEPGLGAFGIYHKALALASSGDYEGADRLLSGPDAQGVMQLRRAVLARVQILSQLERNPDAVALIDATFGARPDATFADLRRRLAAGEPVAFDATRTATDGMAEVFFTLATALNEDADQTYVLLYARAAAALRPDHIEAILMSAGILETLGQYDLASQVFALVPTSDPAHVSARIGQADAAVRAGRTDESVALLQTLATEQPRNESVLTALGDALRRKGACDQAIPAYSGAIALVPDPAPGHWPMYYKRAGCYVVLDDWTNAEADFRFALSLAPNEPRLLNELGYSWVDRGVHLDQALEMIQRAVAASPETGYIVDSLAWAYYRLGRYGEAVAPQEKASRLMPVDPIVTDHLGDIYWQVGRKREAAFQWRRALSFEPDDTDKARIQRKLAVGLDQVLAEEKAARRRMAIEVLARAKINLALHVTGRRADGYHLLDSIVAFADIGDRITVEPAPDLTLTITGPFAAGLSSTDNLVLARRPRPAPDARRTDHPGKVPPPRLRHRRRLSRRRRRPASPRTAVVRCRCRPPKPSSPSAPMSRSASPATPPGWPASAKASPPSPCRRSRPSSSTPACPSPPRMCSAP